MHDVVTSKQKETQFKTIYFEESTIKTFIIRAFLNELLQLIDNFETVGDAIFVRGAKQANEHTQITYDDNHFPKKQGYSNISNTAIPECWES